MMDGNAHGRAVRTGAPKGDTVYVTVGLADSDLTADTQVTYIADDRDTDANELNTKVTVGGPRASRWATCSARAWASKAAKAADGAAGEFVKSSH